MESILNILPRRTNGIRIIALVVIALLLFSEARIAPDMVAHRLFQFAGYILIVVCALGRIYSSVFIGGFKNQRLIRSGPYSIARNPLYVFSYIGAIGVGLLSNRIMVLVAVMVIIALIFNFLVRREETFLLSKFGDEFHDYMNSVPRFIPSFSGYIQPDEIRVRPQLVLESIRDTFVWFLAIPVLQLIEYLQEAQLLPTFFTMW